MACHDIVPYTCVYIDASWRDFLKAALKCTVVSSDRVGLTVQLQRLWAQPQNSNPALPTLSVRTALDLYLRVMRFPPGSEVIMSAINIPSMVQVVHHHGLKVVSLDVDIETTAPKLELLESLINEKTVALLVAHIYGKWFDVQPFINVARKHNIQVIEDCAEGFCGHSRLGDPASDVSLFSFGPIKYYTSFGGAVAKVRDRDVYDKMVKLHNTYPIQTHGEYLNKVLKYSFVYLFLNCPRVIRPAMHLTRSLGIDHKKHVVKLLRGFPNNMMERIRSQPCDALLHMMCDRQLNFTQSHVHEAKMKGDYVSSRLPPGVTQVGLMADVRNFWLFPIVVDNPDEVLKTLNTYGVDAYRGATQLNVVEPDGGDPQPLDGGDPRPLDGGDPRPLDGGDPQPLDGGDPRPLDGGDPRPLDGGDPQPLDVGDPRSLDGGDPQPLDGGDPRPLDGGDPRPLDGGDPRPLDGGDPRPLDGGDPRPLDGGDPRPLDGGDPQPLDGGDPRSLDGGDPRPLGGGDPRPLDGVDLRSLDAFLTSRYPHEARYLIDRVVYLPVNRTVPFTELDKICKAVEAAVKNSGQRPPVGLNNQPIKVLSKL